MQQINGFAPGVPDSDDGAGLGYADVSIVLCTRDRAPMLTAALAALKARTPPSVEIIVVDSGSATIDTMTVAAAAGVRCIRSGMPGLSIARNAGLQSSARAVVVYTDDDCEVMADWLPPLLAALRDNQIGAAAGLLVDEHDDPPPPGARAVVEHRSTVSGLDVGHGALMAFRRSVLLEIGGFDPVLGAGRTFGGAEDLDAFCRVIEEGHVVVSVPDAVVRHVNTRHDADYTKLQRAYGLGLGAMCAKWIRTEPAAGAKLTLVVARRATVRFLRGLRSARRRPAERALIAGFAHGLRTAWRIPIVNGRFVDVTPPAVIEASDEPEKPVEEERVA